ncbi:ETC complex I subunit [Terrihabitans sp. B22-R8]|uniref:ETC complex I subunit n=1 Tax=Terrihabitans sp. B22-R8 TaxID=3425128 RepID=UPI00403C4D4F
MTARIYKPSRNAMQSGTAKTEHWQLDFEPASPRSIDPLMGWTSTNDTRKQVRLTFDTKEEAIAYAQKAGLPYQVFEPTEHRAPRLSYSDNFKWGRVGQWTH